LKIFFLDGEDGASPYVDRFVLKEGEVQHPASVAGLSLLDKINEINGVSVASKADIDEVVGKISVGSVVTFLVSRAKSQLESDDEEGCS
jgi:hypothetical protein